MSTLENSYKQTYINLLIHQITTPLITEMHQETPVDREQVQRQTCLKNNNYFTASPRATYSASEVIERLTHFCVLENQLTHAPAHIIAPPDTDLLSVTLLAQSASAKISKEILKTQLPIHYLIWRYPVYARSAGPANLSGRCADGRSCWLIHESPASTPGPHVPSSTVRHGDGRIPAMRLALHGSRHASFPASPRVPRFYVAANAREIGAGGFNTYAGGVVDAGLGASGAAAGAGDSAATGTDSGIGT